MRRTASMALVVYLLTLIGWAQASDDRQKRSEERPRRQIVLYHLEFTLDETLDGKPSGARDFKMLVQEGETNRVRIGSKVLISAPESEPKFVDIGLKFDCKLNERDGYISIDGKLELNELVSPATSPLAIRTFQAEIETAVLLDKATTIGVYDDAVSKRRYELRATVTKKNISHE
ncbi:MAG: hypothetical protein ACREA2_12175 [Blastocatellia bacterium]